MMLSESRLAVFQQNLLHVYHKNGTARVSDYGTLIL